MDVYAAYPFHTGLQRLQQFLRCEIVQFHMPLGGSEEMRFRRVESNSLDGSRGLAEGRLSGMFGDLMDQY